MGWRQTTIRVFFSLLFLIVFVRLAQIMLLDSDRYRVLAQRQHVVQKKLAAQRGEIFTSDGYPLVLNTTVYRLFAVPGEVEDKKQVLQSLVEVIVQMVGEVKLPEPEKGQDTTQEDQSELTHESNADQGRFPNELYLPNTLHALRGLYAGQDWEEEFKEQLEAKLRGLFDQRDSQYVPLLDKLDIVQKESLESLGLKGLYFESGSKRVYPEGEMAAQLLGFVGKDKQGQDKGYFGLEGYYDGHLSGRGGYELLEKDVGGRRIPYGLSVLRTPSDGRDLVLNIDRGLQFLLEKKISEGVNKYKAESGSVILIDPETGAILAMANAPGYLPEYWVEHLEDETDVSKVKIFSNPAIADNYEPGSVVKPMTISMALEDGIITAETIYHDQGPVYYSGHPVRTWNNKYHGDITMTEILQLSNNTGAAWVGHQIGFDRFNEYLKKYSLGTEIGIDLQGEEGGIVRPRIEWRDIDLANMSFGQGISLTPVQLVTVFSALINGGTLYQPYVVKEIVDHRYGEPQVIALEPKVIGRSISSETSNKIRLMLRKVVTDGEFKWFVEQAGMDKYSIGGKTGTAQIPVGGQYDPDKTNTTFVGFAPVDDPEFLMLVRLNQPTTSTYSAETAVPLWLEIAKDLVLYFKISPISY